MSFNVWNSIDEVAIYLGLQRLSYETDEDLFSRIKKFSKWKYRTDYYTQVHSMPLQIGIDTFNLIKISHNVPGTEFKCSVDWEYFTIECADEYIRVFINTMDCTLKKVLDILDQSTNFSYELQKSKYENFPFKYIIRNKNFKVVRDVVNSKVTYLERRNIMAGSLKSENKNFCINRKDDLASIKNNSDYFLDEEKGYLQLFHSEFNSFFVSYKAYEQNFMLEGSQMNLFPINILANYGITDELIDMMPYVLNNNVWGR